MKKFEFLDKNLYFGSLCNPQPNNVINLPHFVHKPHIEQQQQAPKKKDIAIEAK